MELILLQSVEGLGRPGDQVKVRDGYARNFLLPKGKAVPLSANALRGLSKLKQKADEEEKALLSTMEELAKKLEGTVLKINARATEEGHLFGSVTERDVHAALTTAGWNVPTRSVRMLSHLKQSGMADVPLHLHGSIVTTVKVEVVPVDVEGNIIDVVAPPSQAEAPAAPDQSPEAEAAEPEAEAKPKGEKPAKSGKPGKGEKGEKSEKSEKPARDEAKTDGKSEGKRKKS
jgi:large subunit ribosomal protein L9